MATSSSTSKQATQAQVSTAAPLMQVGPSFWSWFNEYLNAIIGIAALGGQITFTVIVSDIADPSTLGSSSSSPGPDEPTPSNSTAVLFPKEKVRFFIALSWLFFTATLGLAVVAKVLFTTSPQPGSINAGRSAVLVSKIYSGLTLLLNMLPIAAFLLLALAAAAYVPVVGWVGVALIGFFAVLVLVLWYRLDSGMW